jgi:hypothetical protein
MATVNPLESPHPPDCPLTLSIDCRPKTNVEEYDPQPSLQESNLKRQVATQTL